MRVAMVTTHPIQYQVPWLRLLAAEPGVDLTVYFAMLPDAAEQGREFGVAFDWDLPLLGGYKHVVLQNTAAQPSLTGFKGCDTPQLYGEIRRGRFDAVIVNGWGTKTSLQALAACRLTGTPCIVRGEANGLRPRAWWKHSLHSRLLSQYAAHLVIGTNNRRYYHQRGVPDSKMHLTPYCVDNEWFASAADRWRREQGIQALRARFGLQPDLVTFVFSGKFVDKKRPGDLVAALRLLEQIDGPPVQVLMVGDGPLAEGLREGAAGLRMHFTGFLNQSEITAAYAASDCLVLPSDHGETWGLVVNEAMACGLPAIVSDQVGSAVDLVVPGHSGDVYPCGDVAQLGARMAHWASNAAQLRNMGSRASHLVHSEYNFNRVAAGALAALRACERTKR